MHRWEQLPSGRQLGKYPSTPKHTVSVTAAPWDATCFGFGVTVWCYSVVVVVAVVDIAHLFHFRHCLVTCLEAVLTVEVSCYCVGVFLSYVPSYPKLGAKEINVTPQWE